VYIWTLIQPIWASFFSGFLYTIVLWTRQLFRFVVSEVPPFWGQVIALSTCSSRIVIPYPFSSLSWFQTGQFFYTLCFSSRYYLLNSKIECDMLYLKVIFSSFAMICICELMLPKSRIIMRAGIRSKTSWSLSLITPYHLAEWFLNLRDLLPSPSSELPELRGSHKDLKQFDSLLI